ncbi:hypothetical protein HDU83_006112 [Entophlyctis luteolus]|nr:hypothetical protein HDU83_006112 [Entophlyctis luteolus]
MDSPATPTSSERPKKSRAKLSVQTAANQLEVRSLSEGNRLASPRSAVRGPHSRPAPAILPVPYNGSSGTSTASANSGSANLLLVYNPLRSPSPAPIYRNKSAAANRKLPHVNRLHTVPNPVQLSPPVSVPVRPLVWTVDTQAESTKMQTKGFREITNLHGDFVASSNPSLSETPTINMRRIDPQPHDAFGSLNQQPAAHTFKARSPSLERKPGLLAMRIPDRDHDSVAHAHGASQPVTGAELILRPPSPSDSVPRSPLSPGKTNIPLALSENVTVGSRQLRNEWEAETPPLSIINSTNMHSNHYSRLYKSQVNTSFGVSEYPDVGPKSPISRSRSPMSSEHPELVTVRSPSRGRKMGISGRHPVQDSKLPPFLREVDERTAKLYGSDRSMSPSPMRRPQSPHFIIGIGNGRSPSRGRKLGPDGMSPLQMRDNGSATSKAKTRSESRGAGAEIEPTRPAERRVARARSKSKEERDREAIPFSDNISEMFDTGR